MTGDVGADARVLRHLESSRDVVDAALEIFLPPAGTGRMVAHEAMRWSIFAGGKRFRPALVLAAADLFDAPREDSVPAAAAVEMIHTYSLIHDDLPAMDDDDWRRGRPSCHRKFDEAIAILAGDALSNLAFLTLAERVADPTLGRAMIRELAGASGTDGMIGGQVLDIQAENLAPDRALVEDIHRRKTAALIRASVVMGGIAARAGADTLAALARYGEALGLAFQIVDDVIDVVGDPKDTGKSRGKDAAQNKMTYPACYGVTESLRMAEDFAERAVATVRPFDGDGLLQAYASFVVTRRS